MVVLAVQYGQRVQLGFEPCSTAQHGKLAAAPVGDILACDVPVEGVLLQHDLLGAIFADNEEGRTVVADGNRRAATLLTVLRRILAHVHIHADLIVELDCNYKKKKGCACV